MAPHKPEIELFDLRKDPHEVHNVAEDPNYKEIRAKPLAELNNWRTPEIKDQGLSEDFRGKGHYPIICLTDSVGDRVQRNAEKSIRFHQTRHPSWYPTRTLEEWQKVRALREPYAFRQLRASMNRPVIPFTKKPKRPKPSEAK